MFRQRCYLARVLLEFLLDLYRSLPGGGETHVKAAKAEAPSHPTPRVSSLTDFQLEPQPLFLFFPLLLAPPPLGQRFAEGRSLPPSAPAPTAGGRGEETRRAGAASRQRRRSRQAWTAN